MFNDHVAVVTYSTDRSPGFVMYVDRRKGTSYYILLTDNKRIGGIEVSKHQLILDSIKKIDAKKEELSTIKIKERFKDQVETELVSVLDKHQVEANEIKVVSEAFMEKLKKTFDNNKKSNNGIGYISKKDIEKINVFSLLSQEVKKLLGTKNKELKTLTSETDKLQKMIEIEALQEKANKLSELIKDSSAVSEVREKIWRNTGLDDLKQFPPWLPSNCAEPNAIVALSLLPKRFYGKDLGVENYVPNDIVIATYKVPKDISPDGAIQNLEPHERCRNCKITTKDIDKVITDPVWLERIGKWKEDLAKLDLPKLKEKLSGFDLLNDNLKVKLSESNQLKEELSRLDHLKQRSVFLTPYYYQVNRLASINAIDNKNSSLRQKRSPNRQVMVEVEPIAIGHSINATERWSKPNAIKSKKITSSTTSSAARTGSKINDLFNWVKSSIGGLLGSKSKETSSTPSSISQVDAPIDINGTIMLLDVLVRKVTGQKYISKVDQSISPLEAQGYALSIIERFEKVLNETAIKSGISVTNLNFYPVEVQSAIVGQIISENFSKIPKTLYLFAKEACPEFKQTDKFLVHLRSQLEVEKETALLQQKVEKPSKILDQQVSGKVELSKEPNTFLNGTSVIKGISRAIN